LFRKKILPLKNTLLDHHHRRFEVLEACGGTIILQASVKSFCCHKNPCFLFQTCSLRFFFFAEHPSGAVVSTEGELDVQEHDENEEDENGELGEDEEDEAEDDEVEDDDDEDDPGKDEV